MSVADRLDEMDQQAEEDHQNPCNDDNDEVAVCLTDPVIHRFNVEEQLRHIAEELGVHSAKQDHPKCEHAEQVRQIREQQRREPHAEKGDVQRTPTPCPAPKPPPEEQEQQAVADVSNDESYENGKGD